MAIGAFGENFPYTNFHDLNLDWVLRELKSLGLRIDEINKLELTIADPPEWSITRQYEKYTIVFDDGTAYVAKQAVPVGINIDDTDYWNPIFSVADLVQRIADLETEVDTRITDFEENAESTYEKKDALRHLLILGDSYVLWSGARMYSKIVDLMPMPASQIHNLAVSGSSFYHSTNNYLAQLAAYTGDKTEITDILIMGGINDAIPEYGTYNQTYPDISALRSAMVNFYAYARQNYPNAKIHLAYIGGCLASSPYYSQHPPKAQEMAFYAYAVEGANIGYNILAGYNTIHMTADYYSDDGLHPNNAGIDAIAGVVASSFKGQQAVENRPWISANINTASGAGSSILMTFSYKITNDIMEFNCNNGSAILTAGSVLGTSMIEIGTLPNIIKVKLPVEVGCDMIIGNFAGITGRVNVPGVLTFKDGKVYASCYSFNAGTGAWTQYTAQAGANITVAGIHFATPTFNIN